MPTTIPVDGKVTYFGGEWPNPGMLYFAPEESAEGFPLRPASAELEKNGSFCVTSFEPGDGLVPGKYLVTIECWKNDVSAVPAKYQNQSTTDLIVEVDKDQSVVNIDFDVSDKTKP